MRGLDLSKDWYASEFVNHEMISRHREIEAELSFYDAIANGDLDAVTENCRQNMFANQDGVGCLSKDPLQNMKYHFVVTAAMIVRYCVHKGMELEKAYSLSDFYVQTVDSLKTIPEICQLHDKMCLDLCRQMKDLQKDHIISKPVVLCIDYIYSHLHCRITLREISRKLELSESYLSKLFKKEMGISMSDYISELKIEKAKNLLQYSDYTIIDIANYLAFSSESHFIQVFQKITKMTPLQYKKYHFRTKWDGISNNAST